jgi:hypothetical protein
LLDPVTATACSLGTGAAGPLTAKLNRCPNESAATQLEGTHETAETQFPPSTFVSLQVCPAFAVVHRLPLSSPAAQYSVAVHARDRSRSLPTAAGSSVQVGQLENGSDDTMTVPSAAAKTQRPTVGQDRATALAAETASAVHDGDGPDGSSDVRTRPALSTTAQ